MPLSSETLPNRPLNGREVMECVLADLRKMMENDCAFLPGIAYRRVGYRVTVVANLGSSMTAPTTVNVTGGEKMPISDDDGIVVGLEQEVKIENPNLARVHRGIPVTFQQRMPPEPIKYSSLVPGEIPPQVTDPFLKVETKEVRIDPKQYPAEAQAPVVDVSEREAKVLSIPARPGMRERGKR